MCIHRDGATNREAGITLHGARREAKLIQILNEMRPLRSCLARDVACLFIVLDAEIRTTKTGSQRRGKKEREWRRELEGGGGRLCHVFHVNNKSTRSDRMPSHRMLRTADRDLDR